MIWLRSLNIEHVSLADLIRLEISRRSFLGSQVERTIRQGSPLADETALALLRRWFWARKPDAGFALTGFPTTLLQPHHLKSRKHGRIVSWHNQSW